jgi:hypothetical protein
LVRNAPGSSAKTSMPRVICRCKSNQQTCCQKPRQRLHESILPDCRPAPSSTPAARRHKSTSSNRARRVRSAAKLGTQVLRARLTRSQWPRPHCRRGPSWTFSGQEGGRTGTVAHSPPPRAGRASPRAG